MATTIENGEYYEQLRNWFSGQGWIPFPFQEQSWEAFRQGKSGLVNAPTGSGKTYSLMAPIVINAALSKDKGLKAIWITPIRALAKEIYLATKRLIRALEVDVSVAIRTGDTNTKDRQAIRDEPPDILITTPESLHVMFTQKNYQKFFSALKCIVADEWHELIGSKRGLLFELAAAHLFSFRPELQLWGISATIGNMDDAAAVLMGDHIGPDNFAFIRSNIRKQIKVNSVLPDNMESFPWAGHIGIRLLHKVIPMIEESQSTLIFCNTRSQCEIWYQNLLEVKPDLAGLIAMHHSAISDELRAWVEDALHEGKLRAVVCTSSLDLGVDFRPVETVIQIGSPKGVARFLQRAGRSGHRPGLPSVIHFVPTHAMELLEGAALRYAAEEKVVEDRIPYIRSFDVLIQFLMTMAVTEGGFLPSDIFRQVKRTYAYETMTEEEWNWIINFLVHGSQSLGAYDEYQRLGFDRSGRIRVRNHHIARRHRMSIGTIVGDQDMRIRYMSGKKIGTVEERFIAQLTPGDKFWFAGRPLEFVRIKENDVLVKKASVKKAKIPSWVGGRMPLSSQMSEVLRRKIDEASHSIPSDPEMRSLTPLLELQREKSRIPNKDEFLLEYFQTREGYHLLVYPFEGRFVHEGLAALMAWRISKITPISFSLAMNDYGLELLSDQEIPILEALEKNLFSSKNLSADIQRSVNEVEMARRKFRDIAVISGLLFQGFPGRQKRDRHMQSSSSLLFQVFHDYEPDNLLYLQAYEEAKIFQFEEGRLRSALDRIADQHLILKRPDGPTPFAFPIIVDRLSRARMSSESMEDRIKKMQLEMGNK
jgi:ATP-dependent Lhr-like helicase